jgi:hypothetical protein
MKHMTVLTKAKTLIFHCIEIEKKYIIYEIYVTFDSNPRTQI